MSGSKPLVLRVLPELDLGGVESRLRVQASTHSAYRLQVLAFHKDGVIGGQLRADGHRVDILGSPPSVRCLQTSLRLARYLRRLRPDLVHASIVEANWHTAIAARLAGVPAILEEVGLAAQSRRQRIGQTLSYRGAQRIVGVSDAICEDLIDKNHAPRERVRRIYTCAHPRFFPEDRAAPAGAPQGARFVLFTAGRLHAVKNHLGLLEAVARLRQDVKLDVELQIAGEGPARGALERRSAQLNLSGCVRLLGALPDVRPALLAADLFVLPSFVEGCSNALIEALATGRFAAVSDIPGNREVMGELFDAARFPAEDAAEMAARLARLILAPAQERQALAAAGQARAYQEFSAQAYQDRLVSLYRELLPGRL